MLKLIMWLHMCRLWATLHDAVARAVRCRHGGLPSALLTLLLRDIDDGRLVVVVGHSARLRSLLGHVQVVLMM